jgi:TolB-like protein
MQQLIDLARSRNLDKATVAYAVAAWAIVQGIALAASAFAWSNGVVQAAIIIAVLGLPAALAATWAWSVRSRTGSFRPPRSDLALLGLLALLLVLAAGIVAVVAWPRAAPALAANVAPPNSVAVLPFENLSGDPARRYFSEGITDELISELSRIPSLRVAARTSSFAVASQKLDVAAIARKLNVRAVLEGSVRESGGHVRIAAELVSAADGFAIWSETYDRDLTDILNLQDDIAGAVTRALKAKLLGTVFNTNNVRGIDPEAYRLYLQAKFKVSHGTEADLDAAVTLLQRATALAPDFANGFAELAAAYRALVDRYSKLENLPAGVSASRRALALDAKNIRAMSALAQLLLDKWQWNEALDILARAGASQNNSAEVWHLRSNMAYVFAFPKQDIAAEQRAIELDPLEPRLRYGLALAYWTDAQYDAAYDAIEETLRLRHGKPNDLDEKCTIESSRGNLDAARAITRQLADFYAGDPQMGLFCPLMIAFAARDDAGARKLVAAAVADAVKNPEDYNYMSLGDAYRKLGDLSGAMKWYERAYEARDYLVMGVPYQKWQTPALLSDPRWKALWAKPPIRSWEAARTRAAVLLGAR